MNWFFHTIKNRKYSRAIESNMGKERIYCLMFMEKEIIKSQKAIELMDFWVSIFEWEKNIQIKLWWWWIHECEIEEEESEQNNGYKQQQQQSDSDQFWSKKSHKWMNNE